MFINLDYEKLTGNPDSTGWSQAYEYESEDEGLSRRLGKIFAVISTSNRTPNEDNVFAGREILARLHEEYFGAKVGSPFERVRIAVEKVLEEFSSWGDVEIACSVIYENSAFLVVGGGASIAILRDADLTIILSSKEGETSSASGIPKVADVFICGSSQFFNTFPAGVIKASLLRGNLKESIEGFAPTLHSFRSGRAGAIFIKIKEVLSDDQEAEFQELEEKGRVSEDEITHMKLSPGRSFADLGNTLQKLKQKAIFVKKDPNLEKVMSPKGKTMVSVGGILLVLLIVSIIFGLRQKQKQILESKFEESLSSAEHLLAEAEELNTLNPERSRNLFSEAREKVLGITDDSFDNQRLLSLKKRLEENEAKILGEYRVDPVSFVDLSLLSSGFKGDVIIFSTDKAYVLDREGKKIVSVEIGTKRTEVVAGPHQIEEVKSVAIYSDTIYIQNSEGIFVLDKDEKVIDADWTGEVLPVSYAGNIYLIEKSASTIWRYIGDENGFSARGQWLSDDTSVDLTGALSLAIDGSIWVLNEDGEILRFSLGNLLGFNPKGVIPPLTTAKALFTNETLEYLYILDSDNSRIVAVDKEGNYKAQYISDTLKNAKSLVASEDEKKIILLTGDKLLLIEMKHL